MLTQADLKYSFKLVRFYFLFKIFPTYYKPGTMEMAIRTTKWARFRLRCAGLVYIFYIPFLVSRCVYCIILYPSWDPLGTPIAVGQTIAFSAAFVGSYITMTYMEIWVMLINETFNFKAHWRTRDEGQIGFKPQTIS